MRRHPSRTLIPACVALLVAGAATAGDVYLGITMDDLRPSIAHALGLDEDAGVLVDEVMTDSPAAAAGLEAGDVILAIGDEDVRGGKSLVRALDGYEPGDEVEITVFRSGERRTLAVTLGERETRHRAWVGKAPKAWSWFETEEDEDGNTVFRWHGEDGEEKVVIGGLDWLHTDRGYLGIVPGRLDRDELRERGAPAGRGVLIEDVLDDAPAAAAGLEAGDVIVAVDGEPIADGDELHEFLSETEAGETVTVRAIRDGKVREFEVELADSPGRLNIGRNLRMFMPSDPHAPKPPRFYEFHGGGPPPGVDRERYHEEREDLAELKEELAELKEELKKLREELKRNR